MNIPKKFERHELSAAWGDMPHEDFVDLVENVRSQGIINPIVIFEGQILDGWHRYRAAQEVPGAELPIIVFEEDPDYEYRDPAEFVISQNSHRRMLDVGQRALAISFIRQPRSRGNPEWTGQEDRMPMDEIAGEADASVFTMRNAYIVRDDGEYVANIRSGDMTLNQAVRAIKKRDKGEDVSPPPSAASQEPYHEVEPIADEPAIQPRSNTKEALQLELEEIKDVLDEKNEAIDDLRHRIGFLENEHSPVAPIREAKFNSLLEDAKSHKASSLEWQAKYADVLQENKKLERERDHLEKTNLNLRKQLNSPDGTSSISD